MSAYRSSGYFGHVCKICKGTFYSEWQNDDYCGDCEEDE